jgi:uncharacterized protein YecT (DUF1311 family)
MLGIRIDLLLLEVNMKKASGACMSAILFLAGLLPATDDAAIARIRKAYAETSAGIARAQQGGEGGLYANELVVNSRRGSWRGSGNYAKKAVFWYADPPEFAVAEGKEGESVLAKVEVTETAAAATSYAEFLFLDGEPVFVFRRGGVDGPGEERIYLQGGRVVQRLGGAPGPAAAFDPSPMLREAAFWQGLFLSSFGSPAPGAKNEHAIDAWLKGCMEKDASTQGTNACLGQALARWDNEMNRAYQELGGRLDEGRRNSLREAQRAWVAFREKESAWLGNFYGGLEGSMYGSMLAADRVEVPRKRALELASLLDVLEQE